MGWERSLLPPIVKLVDLYPDYPAHKRFDMPAGLTFPVERKKVKQLTPNHHELGLSLELLHSAAYGDSTDWYLSLDKYLHLLRLHLHEIGLWTSEQYTGSPHGGFYLSAMFAARLAVSVRISRGGSLSPADVKLSKLQDEYLRRVYSYMMLTADHTGEVICCGERMPKGPAAPQQSAVYRELRGFDHPNERVISKQIRDDFWLSLRLLKMLIGSGDSLADIRNMRLDDCKLPFTSHAIIVERWPSGHRTRYRRLGDGDGTCQWTWTNNGVLRWGAAGSVMSGRPRTEDLIGVYESARRPKVGRKKEA